MKRLEDWEIFEEEVATYLNGRRQPGSGAPIMSKGDVKSDDFLTECKQTSKDYYSLNIKTWEKICDEARNMLRIPLFAARSKAGDFFLMNQIDYEGELDDYQCRDIGDRKSIKIDDEFLVDFKGESCTYSLVCFQVDLDD